MTPSEALQAAVALVDSLAPRRNERGYTDNGVMQAQQRIDNVLKVADWLLVREPAPATATSEQLAAVEAAKARAQQDISGQWWEAP